MLRQLSGIGLAVMTLFAAPTVRADEDGVGKPVFSFNGFGTLGAAHSDEDKADFTSGVFKTNGAGHTRDWSVDVDSRIGGQLTANLTPRLTGVLQVVSEQRYDSTYKPLVEWANIKYQLTPDFSVRAGRIALPIFLTADYRKVGYAIPWVRMPAEVDGLAPVSSSDGIDATYRLRVGDVINTVQGSYGKTELRISDDDVPKGKDLWALSYTSEIGAASVRLSYLQTNITADYAKPLFNGFRRFGPQGHAIADKYDLDNKRSTFVGFGASYDPGNWFVMSEWGRTNTRSFVGIKRAWYVSGGYRIGALTPYLTYAQAKLDSNRADPGLTVAALPSPFARAVATDLNAKLNALLARPAVQNTISVGARWDFAKNAALKLQYDHIDLGAGSKGMLVNVQPDFQMGGKVKVFSAVVDFVF